MAPRSKKPVRANGSQEPVTTSRKRRASTASVELSEQLAAPHSSADALRGTSEEQSTATVDDKPKSKRRKARSTKTSADSSQLAQELEDDICNTSRDAMETVTEETIAVAETPARHVHFDAPAVTAEKSTATGLTPHPSRSTASRRVTVSPAVPGRYTVDKASHVRRSLPPTTIDSSPLAGAAEIACSPYRDVLNARIERRKRNSHLSEEVGAVGEHDADEREQARQQVQAMEARAEEIELELDLQRQFGIDANNEGRENKMSDLEEELARLTPEIARLRAKYSLEFMYDGANDEDVHGIQDDELVLDSSMDVTYPSLSSKVETTTAITTTSTSSSQNNLPDTRWEAERASFEQAIMRLEREAGDAKAAYEILRIELESLGFPGIDSTTILHSIRESFRQIRLRVTNLLPNQVSQVTNNSQLLTLVVDNVETLLGSTHEQQKTMVKFEEINIELKRQINGLLNNLADAEVRREHLERQWRELDVDNEEKDKQIVDLEAELGELQGEQESDQRLLREREERLAALETEKEHHILSIERLGVALENYRAEEAKLQQLISKMEKDHNASMSKVDKAHKKDVVAFEAQLASEQGKRLLIEEEADRKTTLITELELQIEKDRTEHDNLRSQLVKLQEVYELEKAHGAGLTNDLQEKDHYISELEERVEAAEADLADLNANLEQLKKNLESERRQREAAETELEASNAEVDTLNEKLHAAGLQANELRQKLFGLQMDKEKVIREMEEAAAERDEQYQNDIAAEIARREEALNLAASRNVTIGQLEEELTISEMTMRTLLAERDTVISAQEETIAERQSVIDQLTTTLEATNLASAEYKLKTEAQIALLQTAISDLNETVASRTVMIQTLELAAADAAELHRGAIEDRNAEIADLNHALFSERQRVSSLEASVASLEQRISNEAENYLNLSEARDNDVAVLQALIAQKEAEIDRLATSAINVDAAYLAERKEKDSQIETLTLVADTRLTTLTALTTQLADLKDRYRTLTLSSQQAIHDMQVQLGEAAARADALGEEFVAQSTRALEEVQKMDAVVEMQGKKVRVRETVTVKKVGRSSRRAVAEQCEEEEATEAGAEMLA
ncbi:hypothetical protein LTR16_001352 [Cryomyces antarcticus]|uniref:Up-regulated during septation protein 1 domain-containing protein n=1 Tax=Cryomyces antarcticus TaxID=329879 RepID=A0ABR0KU11_9PEZI|nr:hypothetical protein LTR16_001352 [Cryomyces antarcticus]